MTREEVALQAGTNSGYLDYLERSRDAALTPGALLRLAAALQTTPEVLSRGHVDRPPGPGRGGPHHRLEVRIETETIAGRASAKPASHRWSRGDPR